MQTTGKKLFMIGVLSLAQMLCSLAGGQVSLPAPMSTRQVALEIGICPESLVISDLHAHTQTLLTQLQADQTGRVQLQYLHDQLQAAQATLATATQAAANVGNDSTLASQLTTAQQNVTALQGQIVQLRSELLADLTEGLPAAAVERLSTWRNASGFTVSPPFRVKALTDDQWQAVEGALRAESRAQRLGNELGGEQADLLSGIRADMEVIAAGMRLQSSLTTTQAVFDEFAPPPSS